MLFTSGKCKHTHLTQSVFEFFTTKYEIDSDVEVYHTDLSDDNAFGFTEVNGEEQFIQIHNNLTLHYCTNWFMLFKMKMGNMMMKKEKMKLFRICSFQSIHCC